MFEDDGELAADSREVGGENCTDATKSDYYRQALRAKIAVESAQEQAKAKLASYRNILKTANKAGVNSQAIANAIAQRFRDPDVVFMEERERLKMYELSGFLPGIMDQLNQRTTTYQPTNNEENELLLLQAYDQGVLAGRRGHPRDEGAANFVPGSEAHVQFFAGWRDGQALLGDEMAVPGDKPEPKKRGRPKGSKNKTHASTIGTEVPSDEHHMDEGEVPSDEDEIPE